MSTSPTLVRSLPDLALLACPRPVDRYDRSFFDERWRVLIDDHIPKCRECGFSILLSDEVVVWLQDHFPFTHVGQGSWVDDFQIVFFQLIAEIRKEWPEPNEIGVPPNPVLIEPNILPDYITPQLRDAWLDLLAWSIDQHVGETYIASTPALHAQVTYIQAVDLDNAPVKAVELIPQHRTWDQVLALLDQWVATRLPKSGLRPYQPRQPWHSRQRFPWNTEQKGYIDNDGRVWVWDKYHNNHWDVQYDPPRTGDYDRINRDGTPLPGQD
jgi:hypothetical protein